MPSKPIIQIQVDDSQFKKFLEVYKDYDKSINNMPATWGKIGEAADKTNEHLKTMMGNVGGIAKGFESIAGSIAKMGAFAVAIGAGGIFGLDKFAGGVMQNQRSARAGGLTLGQQSAFRVNTQRYINPDSFLSAVATARQNPQQLAAFAGLGVTPGANESNYDLSKDVFRAIANKMHQTHNLGLMHALGANDFMSDSEIMTLGNTPDSELNAALNTSDRDSRTLGVPNQMANQWAMLSVQLDRAGTTIENSLIRGLEPLAPMFGELSQSVAKSIDAILGSDGFKVVMDDVAGGLDKFAVWLGSADFQKDLDTFGAGIKTAAADIDTALKFLGVIPSTPGAPGSPPQSGDSKPAVAPDPNKVTQNWPPFIRDMLGMPPVKGDSRYEAMAAATLPKAKPMGPHELGSAAGAMGYFMKHGWNRMDAAGIAAQFAFESDYDPNATSWDAKTGLHRGIAQWDATRRAQILAGTASPGRAGIDVWKDQNPTDQYAAVQWELTHTEKAAANAIRDAKTAGQAGVAADNTYERSGDGFFKQAARGLTAGVLNSIVKIKIENPAGANVHHTLTAMVN